MDTQILFTPQGSFIVASSITIACSISLFVTIKAVEAVKHIYHALHDSKTELAHA